MRNEGKIVEGEGKNVGKEMMLIENYKDKRIVGIGDGEIIKGEFKVSEEEEERKEIEKVEKIGLRRNVERKGKERENGGEKGLERIGIGGVENEDKEIWEERIGCEDEGEKIEGIEKEIKREIKIVEFRIKERKMVVLMIEKERKNMRIIEESNGGDEILSKLKKKKEIGKGEWGEMLKGFVEIEGIGEKKSIDEKVMIKRVDEKIKKLGKK